MQPSTGLSSMLLADGQPNHFSLSGQDHAPFMSPEAKLNKKGLADQAGSQPGKRPPRMWAETVNFPFRLSHKKKRPKRLFYLWNIKEKIGLKFFAAPSLQEAWCTLRRLISLIFFKQRQPPTELPLCFKLVP